jgi:GT2 family glycosyltransferase
MPQRHTNCLRVLQVKQSANVKNDQGDQVVNSDIPDISAVILTCNRADRCADSVWHNALSMQGRHAEIIVINNGTEPAHLPARIADTPCRVIQMPRNLGALARNEGLRLARGAAVLALDDDSYIDPGLIEAMLNSLNRDPRIGAVAFRIQNGDSEESCLLPTVFHGCACGFRRSALMDVGGYPAGYLYYGEEYDLAFRLYQAGYRITFCNLSRRVRHVRDGAGRSNDRILRLLVRNNACLWFAFLPLRHILPAFRDMLQRYALVAAKEGATRGFRAGCTQIPAALVRGLLNRRPLSPDVFRKIFLMDRLESLCRHPIFRRRRRVILCGVGKFPSLWTHFLRQQGIEPAAFWDHNPCWLGQSIDGVPVHVAGSELPAAPPDSLWLVGATSLAENARWQDRLEIEMGLSMMNSAQAAPVAAGSTSSVGADLGDVCEMGLYYREGFVEQPFRARGIRPASISTAAKSLMRRGKNDKTR